ncbi:MAG: cytochrome c3 family protein [Bdellovibrionota bacterium]
MIFNLGIFTQLGIAVAFGSTWFLPSVSNQGYSPEQPIPFNHKQHAGENKIECLYCHADVERSRHASVPSINVCMNCHLVVQAASPHIQKLRDALAQGKPIQWVRVHELADYVYFTHKRHIARGLACEDCHGDVKKMDKIEQVAPLTMGWCMDCHRGKTTPKRILSKYYSEAAELNGHMNGSVAPTSCTTCHN